METGKVYVVTYKTAVNRDWTRTEDMVFSGTYDGKAVFTTADAWQQTRKPLYLTIDRIVALEAK